MHLTGLGIEAVNAVKYRDKETANYLRFYLRQLRRVGPPLLSGRAGRQRRRTGFTARTRVTAPRP
jgi:hypothetical protein